MLRRVNEITSAAERRTGLRYAGGVLLAPMEPVSHWPAMRSQYRRWISWPRNTQKSTKSLRVASSFEVAAEVLHPRSHRLVDFVSFVPFVAISSVVPIRSSRHGSNGPLPGGADHPDRAAEGGNNPWSCVPVENTPRPTPVLDLLATKYAKKHKTPFRVAS